MTGRFHCYRRSFESSLAQISTAVAWVKKLATRHGMGSDALFRLDLCASELLANVVEHAYRGAEREVRVYLFADRDSLSLTIEDSGRPFDPELHVPRPLPQSLMDVEIGGLGLRLVRQFADSLVYERCGGRNRLTLRMGGSDGKGAPGHIGDVSLFRGVPTQQVDAIVARCELRTCVKDEVLFRKGDDHRCVLVNLEGRLRVHLDEPDSVFFLELGVGESVGELSVADGKAVSAWVIAATSCRLLVIPEWVFLDNVLAVPTIARNLIVLMSERMRRSDAHILARARAAVELEALQRELDFARQIQSNMLPMTPLFANVDGIRGRGFMRAARRVGGDFYDGFPLSSSRVFAATGDVCSKGLPAALFMVRTLTLLRSEAMIVDEDAERHLARLVGRCNELLNESNEAQLFVTLFCAIFDVERDRMYYVNAGHNPPLLRLPGSEPVLLSQPRNPLVGIVPSLQFAVGTCAFPPGSLCVLYTDGVTEAENSAGALFSDAALHSIVRREELADVDSCVDAIIAAVDEFAGEHPQADDITLVAIQRTS
jgi:phosphoserine phosphatase RsbU/P